MLSCATSLRAFRLLKDASASSSSLPLLHLLGLRHLALSDLGSSRGLSCFVLPLDASSSRSSSETGYHSTMPLSPVQSGNRKVAIAVDLSDESAYAVRWAVANYLRSDDTVILLHVQPTNVLYGADWGDIDQSIETSDEEPQPQQLAEEFDTLTSHKIAGLAEPLVDAGIPYKTHVVKDHDMKERICLEAERLRVNAMVMGSRGFGAVKKASKTRLGSVSDYCVHHCECPVMVVRFPEDGKEDAPVNGEKVSVAV